MEAPVQNTDEEVDGVSGEFSFWPSPVALFDQEAWMFFNGKIACVEREQIESPSGQEWR